MENKIIGVVGAGQMGSGIAEVVLVSGHLRRDLSVYQRAQFKAG
jgi:3-hydroxyacyl-CoA dehydrogenase